LLHDPIETRLIEIKVPNLSRCFSDQQAAKSAREDKSEGSRKMSTSLIRIAGAAGLLALGTTLAEANDVAQGKALVEANCAPCHAVGLTDESPHTDAPPFRTLSKRYPIDALEEAFAEGISTGHPDMPQFVATPQQISAILAYISSLNR
jgi:mono/diheme cytochrome c family protein